MTLSRRRAGIGALVLFMLARCGATPQQIVGAVSSLAGALQNGLSQFGGIVGLTTQQIADIGSYVSQIGSAAKDLAAGSVPTGTTVQQVLGWAMKIIAVVASVETGNLPAGIVTLLGLVNSAVPVIAGLAGVTLPASAAPDGATARLVARLPSYTPDAALSGLARLAVPAAD